MTTADRIKNRRIELGLTQLEVAKRLGLSSKVAVSKVENQGDKVTLKNVEKYAKVLDCSVKYLMGWEDEEKDEDKEREERFINYYSQLDDNQKTIIDNLLASLVKKQ